MAFLPLAMMAYDAEIDGIYYNVIQKGSIAVVTQGDNPYTGDVVIPPTIVFEGKVYTVKSIGDNAFNGCSGLTNVDIPSSVTSIGSSSFYNCSGLTNVDIPSSVTSIGNHAFDCCTGLTSVTIPEGVTSINEFAFASCHNLTSVTIPEGVTSIGKYAFVFCVSLRSVTIPSSVKDVVFGAFYDSGLTSVTFRSSATGIGRDAFQDCYVATINIFVTDYASYCSCSIPSAFDGCVPVHDINGNEIIHLYDINGNEITDFNIPYGVNAIGNCVFKNCTGLTNVTIPSSVTSIDRRAFYNCSGLTSVNIPGSVVSIGGEAFRNCTGLTSMTIPSSVTSIGDNAFSGCPVLRGVTIEGSPNIGSEAFAYCENLEVVTCNATTVPSTNTNAFDGSYTEYATLIVPDEAQSDYQTTAPWSNFGTLLGSSQAAVVTANSYTREYGEPNPTFEYTSDIPLDGMPSITCSANESTAPGVYPIVITQGKETNAGLIYVDGTLTITKAPLTITAKSYTVNAGDAMPNFEVEYRGFKNNETADDLTSQPTISCTASDTYTEGIYDITVSGAASDNYDISYVAGKLTVAPTDAHITITSAGMGTYCSPYDLDFTGVTDLKAYTITGYDKANSRVYATRVYDVPAGTGLYLVGNPGDYDVPISTSNSYYINMLVGTLEQTWIDTTDGDLTNLRLTGTNPSNASFKILSEGRNFSANRAYLQIPTYILGNTANAATAFGIVLDDDTNGIEDIMLNSDDTDSEWYTLDGRKLNGKPTARGIYVVKGRKVVIK